jgi:hypothetical protein
MTGNAPFSQSPERLPTSGRAFFRDIGDRNAVFKGVVNYCNEHPDVPDIIGVIADIFVEVARNEVIGCLNRRCVPRLGRISPDCPEVIGDKSAD